jgi:hypothetical protein
LPEARKDELVTVVGQADGRRDAAGAERHGRRIALRRIDRQTQAERAQQQGRVTAERGDIGIGLVQLAAGQHTSQWPAATTSGRPSTS